MTCGELPDQPDEGLGRRLDVLQGEAAVGQRRQRVALGQPGVDKAQPLLLDAQDLPGLVHFLLPYLVDVLLDKRIALEFGVEDGSPLTACAGGDQHVHPSDTYLAMVAAPLLDSSSGWA